MKVDSMVAGALVFTAGFATGVVANKGTEQAIDNTKRWQAGTIGLALTVPGALGAMKISSHLADADLLSVVKTSVLLGAALGVGALLGAGFAGLNRYDALA